MHTVASPGARPLSLQAYRKRHWPGASPNRLAQREVGGPVWPGRCEQCQGQPAAPARLFPPLQSRQRRGPLRHPPPPPPALPLSRGVVNGRSRHCGCGQAAVRTAGPGPPAPSLPRHPQRRNGPTMEWVVIPPTLLRAKTRSRLYPLQNTICASSKTGLIHLYEASMLFRAWRRPML